MRDNIIYDNDDNAYGFYSDLYKSFVNQINEELKSRNIEQAQTLVEELNELADLCNYTGIIKVSNCNGMGFMATKYKGED